MCQLVYRYTYVLLRDAIITKDPGRVVRIQKVGVEATEIDIPGSVFWEGRRRKVFRAVRVGALRQLAVVAETVVVAVRAVK